MTIQKLNFSLRDSVMKYVTYPIRLIPQNKSKGNHPLTVISMRIPPLWDAYLNRSAKRSLWYYTITPSFPCRIIIKHRPRRRTRQPFAKTALKGWSLQLSAPAVAVADIKAVLNINAIMKYLSVEWEKGLNY